MVHAARIGPQGILLALPETCHEEQVIFQLLMVHPKLLNLNLMRT